MRKYILLGLLIGIMPNICLGASIRYSQLIKEKQRKIEELEKCTGSTGKLKIAGISTLGLTAAGVAGNVVEAQKIKEYGKESEKLDKKLETARTEKEAEEKKLKEKEKRETESKECMESEGFKNAKLIENMKKDDEGNCVIESCVKNASENEDGTDCECKDQYEESGNRCVKKEDPQKLSEVDVEKDTEYNDAYLSWDFGGDCNGALDSNSNRQSADSCGNLNRGQWKVEFEYGVVYGETSCNTIAGKDPYDKIDDWTFYSENKKAKSEMGSLVNTGGYCWCRVTKYISKGGSEQSLSSSSWLFGAEDACGNGECSQQCAQALASMKGFREAAFE